jgi:hypothetical protein
LVSTGFTLAAMIRTNTCPAPGTGSSKSAGSKLSGPPPYADKIMAFIVVS